MSTLPIEVTPGPSRGHCPVCTAEHALTPTGRLTAHGPHWGRCPGGGRPPSKTTARLTDAARTDRSADQRTRTC